MKYFFIIGLFIKLSCIAQVQKSESFSMDAGIPYKHSNTQLKFFSKIDDTNCIYVKINELGAKLQKYNTIKNKEIAQNLYTDFPKNFKVQYLLKLSNQLHLIYEVYDQKEKQYHLYSRSINTESTSFSAPVLLLNTAKNIINLERNALDFEPILPIGESDYDLLNSVHFQVIKSANSKYFGIIYQLKESSKTKKWVCHVYDTSLNFQWENQLGYTLSSNSYFNIETIIDSNGDVINLDYYSGSNECDFVILNKNKEIQHRKVELNKDVRIQKLKITETLNGNLFCSGFYANEIYFDNNLFNGGSSIFNTKGIITLEIQKSGEVNYLLTSAFEEKMTAQAQCIDGAQKLIQNLQPKNDLSDLKILSLQKNDDSSYLIIGEQQYLRNEMVISTNQFVNHFRNILVAKLNLKGQLIWMHKIPKNQSAVTNEVYEPFFYGQLSFSYAKASNHHMLFFIDNPKNEFLEAGFAPYEHKNELFGFLSAATIDDKTGAIKRHTLSSIWNVDQVRSFYDFNVGNFYTMGSDAIYLETFKKYQNQDVTIKINWLNK